MRESNRTNISAIALFLGSLDRYEETIDTSVKDPTQLMAPAQHLQIALNRLITANIPDGFQMMRHLADRMIAGKDGIYSQYTMLLLASGSTSAVFKDEIMAVIYPLLQVMRGETPNLDLMWKSRVYSNYAIESFLNLYPTSDQKQMSGSYQGNLVVATPSTEMVYSDQVDCPLYLGVTDKEVTLTSTNYQIIRFGPEDDLPRKPNYRVDLPTTIRAQVTLRPHVGQFILDKSIKYTDTALDIMNNLGCINRVSRIVGDLTLRLPGPFFSAKLDVASFDSGASWIVGNVQIIPPTLK